MAAGLAGGHAGPGRRPACLDGPPNVYIIDDDAAVRDGLSLLCETAGLSAALQPDAAWCWTCAWAG